MSAGATTEASAVMVNYAQSDPNRMESKQGAVPRPTPSAELERNPQAELTFTVAVGQYAGDLAELGVRIEHECAAVDSVISNVEVRLPEVRCVGDVVKLDAERDINPFRNVEILKEREVQIRQTGADHQVTSGRPRAIEADALARSVCEQRSGRGGKCRGIEVIRDVPRLDAGF